MRAGSVGRVGRALAGLGLLFTALDLTQACQRPLEGAPCACPNGICSCLSGWQCCADRTCHSSCESLNPPAPLCEPAAGDGESGQWCWVSPNPSGRLLFEIWGPSSDQLWAGGEGGVLLRKNGARWKAVDSSAIPAAIRSIWGPSIEDFWIAADSGLYHWQRGLITQTSKRWVGHVWGRAADDVWAVGKTTIWHRAGESWSAEELADDTDLRSIWGCSAHPADQLANEAAPVWAVGKDQILERKAGTWSQVLTSSICGDEIVTWNEVHGRTCDDVWVASDAGKCTLHWNGTEWNKMQSDEAQLRRLFAIQGTEDVGALNVKHEVRRWNGQNWTPLESLDSSAQSIKAVWASAKDEVITVGGGAHLRVWQNGAATEVSPFAGVTWSDLSDLHGLSSKAIWVVGAKGLILHYDGQAWSEDGAWPPTAGDLVSVWAADVGDVWAVSPNGDIVHRDDHGWSFHSNVPAELSAVWASESDDAWAVGMNGAVFRFQGSEWRPMPPPTPHNLLGIWGSASNDVWAVGGYFDATSPTREVAELHHWNGDDWDSHQTIAISAAEAGLDYDEDAWPFCTERDAYAKPFGAVDMWGSSASNVWATTRCAGPLHFDGKTWSHGKSLENDRDTRGIWADSSSVWIVGNWGRIDRRYEDGWHDVSLSGIATPRLTSVWGTTTGEIWAIGADGTILHNDLGASSNH